MSTPTLENKSYDANDVEIKDRFDQNKHLIVQTEYSNLQKKYSGKLSAHENEIALCNTVTAELKANHEESVNMMQKQYNGLETKYKIVELNCNKFVSKSDKLNNKLQSKNSEIDNINAKC
eukprot:796555_1